jgi:putative glycosyltransferase (TIGR04348 family)
MKVQIITPAPKGSRHGNRVTALRWQSILESLGHRVVLSERYDGEEVDVMIALHARRSAPAIERFAHLYPRAPIVVALTGTDVYKDISRSVSAVRSLKTASRLVTLQGLAELELPINLRPKVRVIHQSVDPTPQSASRDDVQFDVCVVAHLRPVKDPFRAAFASRILPKSSRIRILQVGSAMSDSMARRATAEMKKNPRFLWFGDCSRDETRQIISRSRVLVLSSRLEGGANVISEAIVDHVPIVASEIPGSVGLLGPDYPAYFQVGDTKGLATLLWKLESDRSLLQSLRDHCRNLAPYFSPQREKTAWENLLRELL